MFWSDLGPQISYEAVGITDAKLKTVSVWAKPPTKDAKNQEFEKGVVLYLNPQSQIVGVLMWNIHGQVALARKVLKEQRQVKDVNEIAALFRIHG